MTPLLAASIGFAHGGGLAFVAAGICLTVRRRRMHPLLLVCIAAISISWIEAPYDWAVHAQFAPAIPRMPPWWPLHMTWGGLPASVPPGYVAYFVLPAVVGAASGNRLSRRFGWRRPHPSSPPDWSSASPGPSSSTGSWAPVSASATTAG